MHREATSCESRPWARRAVSAVLGAALAAIVFASAVPAARAAGGEDHKKKAASADRPAGALDVAALEQAVAAEINAERAKQGLAPLALSPELSRLARFYSKEMVEEKFFDHRDPAGTYVRNRVESVGVTNWTNVGENLARNQGFGDPATVAVTEWMKSQGHRQNILNDKYRETGIGVWVAPDKTVYFTQIFLTRRP